MKTRNKNVCDPCRKRKLGCDGKRPICSQCHHGRRQCTGYDAKLTFVDPWVSKSCSPADKRSKTKVISAVARANRTSGPPTPSRRTSSQSPNTYRFNTITPSLTWPLNDIVSLCVQNFVPAAELSSSTSASFPSRICGQWVEVLPLLVGGSENQDQLCAAVRSFGMAILAWGSRGRAPIPDAVEAHGRALRAVHSCINHRNVAAFSSLAASIMCLYLSERLLLSTIPPTSIHTKGLADLVQAHDPSFFASGPCRQLFFGFTPMLVLDAISTHKSTFLCQTEWKEDPFAQCAPAPLQVLLSRASSLSTILESLKSAGGDISCSAMHVAKTALAELGRILESLDDWFSQTRSQNPEMIIFCPKSQGFDEPFDFPDISTANCMTHYWAFKVLCIAEMEYLEWQYPQLSAKTTYAGGNPGSNSASNEIEELSSWIIRSTEFITQDKMKLFGVASVHFPIRTVYNALLRHQEVVGDPNLLYRFADRHKAAFRKLRRLGYEFTSGSYPFPDRILP